MKRAHRRVSGLALAALLVSGAALALPPVDDTGGDPRIPCTKSWTVRVCADETALRQAWTETLNASTAMSGTPFAGIAFSDAETVDITFNATISTGDGALVALLDVNALVTANPALGPLLLAAQAACSAPGTMSSDDCQNAVTNIRNTATSDQIHNSSQWGHECKGADDQVQKVVTGVRLNGPHLLVAVSEDGSSAAISARITHHSAKTTTESVCGSARSGTLSLTPGTYSNRSVGTVPIDVQPVAGGTLANVRLQVTEHPTLADGSFSLSTTTLGANASLRFTGDVITCAELNQ